MFKCLWHFIKKLYSHNFASKTHHIYFSHFPGILVEMYYIENIEKTLSVMLEVSLSIVI